MAAVWSRVRGGMLHIALGVIAELTGQGQGWAETTGLRVGIGEEGVRREASLGFEVEEIQHIGGIEKVRCMKIVVEVQGVPV